MPLLLIQSLNPSNLNNPFFSLILLLLLLLLPPLASMTPTTPQTGLPCAHPDSGPVVPTTRLVSFLERLQQSALRTLGHNDFDPKLYVDLSLRFDLSTTEESFNELPGTAENGTVSPGDLSGFIGNYLNGAGEDLVESEPVDFVAEPEGFLPKVENREVRAWALKVHSLWKNLSRRVADSVLDRPEFHTLLPLPEPVIIPGSRFREVYYWDSYWVIKGLLASKMHETAKGIVINLISLMDQFGYVLNGARAYYTNRSQPPLLSAMVYDVYNRTGDIELVRKSLPALLKEHAFWTTGIHNMTIQDGQGRSHSLSRYFAMWNEPRPESSTLDKEIAAKLPSSPEKQKLYRELASTAESGWDFSSRWMRDASDLASLATTSILPVDLNIFVLKMELDISFLADVLGERAVAQRFLEASKARQQAVNSIFWNAEMGQWLDYWLTNSTACKDSNTWEATNQNKNVFASNFIPLWIGYFNSDVTLVEKVMQSLRGSGLLRDAGIATSMTNSGQQWDYPNGWAPLQHLIVEGLLRSGSEDAKSLARDIAVRWIRTNYVTFKNTGAMHEKYNVERCGEFGGGGEYVPQTGFGWSNGVVLAFLEEFGWPQDLNADCA